MVTHDELSVNMGERPFSPSLPGFEVSLPRPLNQLLQVIIINYESRLRRCVRVPCMLSVLPLNNSLLVLRPREPHVTCT